MCFGNFKECDAVVEVKRKNSTLRPLSSLIVTTKFTFLFTMSEQTSTLFHNMRLQRVVHISGSPGSGKTTLGREFCAAGVEVIDTDELISDSEGQSLYALRDSGQHEAALREWQIVFTRNLRQAYTNVSANTNTIIFVGILNHFSANGSILELPFEAEKYFIDLPYEQLLQQFYGRYGIEMKTDTSFWSGVAQGRWDIPSSKDYKLMHEEERTWHTMHAYEMLSPHEITLRIKNFKT